MALGSSQPLLKKSLRNIPGGKGGRCHEIWEPKPPGTFWATPDLLRDCFTIFLVDVVAQELLIQYCREKINVYFSFASFNLNVIIIIIILIIIIMRIWVPGFDAGYIKLPRYTFHLRFSIATSSSSL